MNYYQASEVTCPYCGFEYHDSDEAFGSEEGGTEICGVCEKLFRWSTNNFMTFNTIEVSEKKEKEIKLMTLLSQPNNPSTMDKKQIANFIISEWDKLKKIINTERINKND